MGWVERERERKESNARNTFGLDTRTILANKTLNEIPFNIVWLMFFVCLSVSYLSEGCFGYSIIRWIHTNSSKKKKSLKSDKPRAHGQKATHLRIYTYSTEEKKTQIHLIIITNRFLLFILFLLCLCSSHQCFHCVSISWHFPFATFHTVLGFLYLLASFSSLFFLCVCDFGILPLFEYATTDQKWININYATQLNHRTHSNNDSPELKAYHRPWNSFMDKTFAHNKWKKTQAPYQMDPFSVGQSELATITIK